MMESPVYKREVKISSDKKSREIKSIKYWLTHDYLYRLAIYNNNKYFGLPVSEELYDINIDAYNKRQRLAELEGCESLPSIKMNKII